MGIARCILRVEFGVPARASPRPANVTLPRIVPAPRRPSGRTWVRWTLEAGVPPRFEASASRCRPDPRTRRLALSFRLGALYSGRRSGGEMRARSRSCPRTASSTRRARRSGWRSPASASTGVEGVRQGKVIELDLAAARPRRRRGRGGADVPNAAGQRDHRELAGGLRVKAAVLVFPGSNCDRDLAVAFRAAGRRGGDGLAQGHRAARRAPTSSACRAALPGATTCAAAPSRRGRRSSRRARGACRSAAATRSASATASRC